MAGFVAQFQAGSEGHSPPLLQANLARGAAAQVVAKVAAIELPLRSWQEAIPALQSNMQQDSSELKQATLEALGYVCEEMAAIQETVLDQESVS